MATKKSSGKSKPAKIEAKPEKVQKTGPVFRGARKAEQFGRMIERLREKFPLDRDSAGEWLAYARIMKTTAEISERAALDAFGPMPGEPQSRIELTKKKAKLRAGKAVDEDDEEEDSEEEEETE